MAIRRPQPFFDAVDNDRIYSSADFRRIFHRAARDGIVKSDREEMHVFARSPAEMAVEVGLGSGFVQGAWVEVYDAREVVGIQAAHPTSDRIDRVILQLDAASRSFAIIVRTGLPAVTPVPPTLIRDESIWELSLAQIRVPAGAVLITTNNITDERLDSRVCGVAASPSAVAHIDGVPSIQADTLTQRPASPIEVGRLFIAIDQTRAFMQSTGSTWALLGHSQVSARVYRSSPQTVNQGQTVPVIFDIARWDEGGMWNVGDPTRLTAPETGLYQIIGNARLSGTARHQYKIRLNGSTVIAQQTQMEWVVDGIVVTTQYLLHMGDYVELLVSNASTANQTVTVTPQWTPEFMMTRTG